MLVAPVDYDTGEVTFLHRWPTGLCISSEFENVPDAFRAIVATHADRCAIAGDSSSLSYGELDRLSNRIANHLIEAGGRAPVAMAAPLEPVSLAVMLGTLKAGRLFAPIDPREPSDRVEGLRRNVGAQLVSPAIADAASLNDDRDPKHALRADDPAVVYFTSGSSGQPKGAIRSHGQLASAMAYGVQPDDRFALILPLAFAASITPVFETLLSGGTLCLFDPAARGLVDLTVWLDRLKITAIKTSPSVLRTIAATIERRGGHAPSVRLAIIGGEPTTTADLEALVRVFSSATLINHYGSTEAGYIAFTTIVPGDPIDSGSVRFRLIFPGQQVEVVGEDGRPAPIGEAGDLVVSGPYVAFPLAGGDATEVHVRSDHGRRSVAVGDRARFLPDGSLEYLGRGDRRLKIRGQTIDPVVVEQALTALPGIHEAVVSLVEGPGDDGRLVAHFVPTIRPGPRTGDLRASLAVRLPPFMVPASFIKVRQIPQTPRGKVDRDALGRSARALLRRETDYVAPRDENERTITDIASRLLNLERVGVGDDLFELGIDSLSAIEFIEAVRGTLRVDLRVADLLHAPTPAALALHIAAGTTASVHEASPLATTGSGTPLFLVAPGPDRLMLPMRRLARLLNRPTYAMMPHGFDEHRAPDRTIEQAAARYLRAIRTVQPTGPHLIGGQSFGGLVAYEIAQQLAAAGEQPALLLLLDPASGAPSMHQIVRRIARGGVAGAGDTAGLPRRLARQAHGELLRRIHALTARVRPGRRSGPAVFFYASRRMKRGYRPRPYSGRTLLLRTADWEHFDLMDMRRFLTGETVEQMSAGTHMTLLEEPQVVDVAATLRSALGAADPAVAIPDTRDAPATSLQ